MGESGGCVIGDLGFGDLGFGDLGFGEKLRLVDPTI